MRSLESTYSVVWVWQLTASRVNRGDYDGLDVCLCFMSGSRLSLCIFNAISARGLFVGMCSFSTSIQKGVCVHATNLTGSGRWFRI